MAAVTTIVAGASVRFQTATPLGTRNGLYWQTAQRLPVPTALGWQRAVAHHTATAVGWDDAIRTPKAVGSAYQRANPLQGAPLVGRYQQALRVHREKLTRYQDALLRHGTPVVFRYQSAIRVHKRLQGRYQRALAMHADALRAWEGSSTRAHSNLGSRYQDAIHYSPGVYVGPGPGPGEGPGPEPGETILVPVRRTYMTINTLALRRVDTDQELLAYGFTLAIDADSWTWSWSATLRADAMAVVQRAPGADPVVVEATLNGVAYRFLVERISRQQQFSSTRISVAGRGLAAILASPFAPSMTHGSAAALTAQQLMANVLTFNGVGIGWDIDWQLDDWSVPGGAWALQGSYMEAVQDIAAAAGGYVQPHATDQVLHILPRYPRAPWAWGDVTPDIELPAAPVQVVTTEWVDRPAYNRVYVGGTGAGVFGPVTRAGTAGDILASQVNHALITHAAAHRQRGLAELASGGRQVHLTLNMQVLPETGLILPGKFVRYLGGASSSIGIVRSMSYDWSSKRQTIEIETHDT